MAKNDLNTKCHEGWKTDKHLKSVMPVNNWKVQKLREELAAGERQEAEETLCELGATRWKFEIAVGGCRSPNKK
jgi:hypothetical protein